MIRWEIVTRTSRLAAALACLLVCPAAVAACDSFSGNTQDDAGATFDAQAGDAGGFDATPPEADADVDDASDAATVKRVFVSDGTYNGDLEQVAFTLGVPKEGGTAAADYLCDREAKDQGLNGRWRAWVAGRDDAGTNLPAAQRFRDKGPRYDSTRTRRVFLNLTQNPTGYMPRVDGGIAIGRVWTGLNADGTGAVVTCNNWTSTTADGTYGIATPDAAAQWQSSDRRACDVSYRLYCFED